MKNTRRFFCLFLAALIFTGAVSAPAFCYSVLANSSDIAYISLWGITDSDGNFLKIKDILENVYGFSGLTVSTFQRKYVERVVSNYVATSNQYFDNIVDYIIANPSDFDFKIRTDGLSFWGEIGYDGYAAIAELASNFFVSFETSPGSGIYFWGDNAFIFNVYSGSSYVYRSTCRPCVYVNGSVVREYSSTVYPAWVIPVKVSSNTYNYVFCNYITSLPDGYNAIVYGLGPSNPSFTQTFLSNMPNFYNGTLASGSYNIRGYSDNQLVINGTSTPLFSDIYYTSVDDAVAAFFGAEQIEEQENGEGYLLPFTTDFSFSIGDIIIDSRDLSNNVYINFTPTLIKSGDVSVVNYINYYGSNYVDYVYNTEVPFWVIDGDELPIDFTFSDDLNCTLDFSLDETFDDVYFSSGSNFFQSVFDCLPSAISGIFVFLVVLSVGFAVIKR